MAKFFIFISLLSNLSQSQNIKNNQIPNDPTLFPWLTVSILLLFVMFFFFYKALKTQERKYNYYIIITFSLLVVLLFI
jgi:cell division protein FtsW (lipid II flippase)